MEVRIQMKNKSKQYEMYSISQEIEALLKSKKLTNHQLDFIHTILDERVYPRRITSCFDLDDNENGDSYFIHNDVIEILIDMKTYSMLKFNNLEALKNRLNNYNGALNAITFFKIGTEVNISKIIEWQDEISSTMDKNHSYIMGWETDSSKSKKYIDITIVLDCPTKKGIKRFDKVDYSPSNNFYFE